MTKFILDAATGEVEILELTEKDVAELEELKIEANQRQTDRKAQAARRLEILEKLGLTEDEARVLLG
jgi:hypothetical protein